MLYIRTADRLQRTAPWVESFEGGIDKLRKIILEDEGLKMMDLLVAANLALWWRAYEKATSSRGDRGSI